MRKRMVMFLLACAVGAGLAYAAEAPPAGVGRPWKFTFDAVEPAGPVALNLDVAADEQRPVAQNYSESYKTRVKIHKYASFATAPLFVAQYLVGQELYDGGASESMRSAHSALAAGTAALFAVNTVTGVWNLWEGRHDPNGRTRRWVHGLMMLGADAGFVATAALAPDDDEGGGNRSTHRTVAITSMITAAASYVIMLLPH